MQNLEAEVVRVCSNAFVKDLSRISTENLRSRKEEAESVEDMVSYARRIIQGRLDTLEFDPSELGLSDEADLEGITRLTNAIAGGTHRTSENLGKFVDSKMSSSAIEDVDAEITELIERMRHDEDLNGGSQGQVSEESYLRKTEALLSQWRQSLFASIDALRAELVVRYRDDDTMVDELLAKMIKRDDDSIQA